MAAGALNARLVELPVDQFDNSAQLGPVLPNYGTRSTTDKNTSMSSECCVVFLVSTHSASAAYLCVQRCNVCPDTRRQSVPRS
eukprot:3253945-Amphidinium_carterae.1